MKSARGTEALAWILAIILAVVFLAAGVPKLIGTGTPLPQAAAMQGFPGWIRVVTGTVEVLGAIALLIPGVSSFAALLLALLMIPATLTQRMSGAGGTYVPLLLFVLLLALAWLRNHELVRARARGFAATPHPLLHEGIAAGLIGATCIALWFFGVDLVAGRPLFTPATLGRALLRVLGPVPASESMLVPVLAYTIFHYAAFIVVGLAAALLVHAAGREPALLVGFVVLFVAFEVGFYALVALLQQATPLGALAWPQVMLGNLIAAVAMGAYLLHHHPGLRDRFIHALDART